MTDSAMDITQISTNANIPCENEGNPSTFMPKKLDITVGMAKSIVIAVKKRITRFRLFDIMEENVSASRAKIVLYISTISRA